MNATLRRLTPAQVDILLKDGRAVVVDIREPDEFAQRHIPGAVSHPLSAFGRETIAAPADRTTIFTCKSGMRTANNCQRLSELVEGDVLVLDGGLDAWASAGLPTAQGRR